MTCSKLKDSLRYFCQTEIVKIQVYFIDVLITLLAHSIYYENALLSFNLDMDVYLQRKMYKIGSSRAT
jgi:hypothetical protein